MTANVGNHKLPPVEPATADLRYYFWLFLRAWWLFVGAVILTAVIWLLVPAPVAEAPYYRATAHLLAQDYQATDVSAVLMTVDPAARLVTSPSSTHVLYVEYRGPSDAQERLDAVLEIGQQRIPFTVLSKSSEAQRVVPAAKEKVPLYVWLILTVFVAGVGVGAWDQWKRGQW